MISEPQVPIRNDDVMRHWGTLQVLLNEIEWGVPKDDLKIVTGESDSATGKSGFYQARRALQSTTQERASLINAFKKVSGDPYGLTQNNAFLADAIRTGCAIGMHLANQYNRSSGLEHLIALNTRPGGRVPESQEAEFHAKQRTASAILLFSLASYVFWKLSQYKYEEVHKINVRFNGVPDMDVSMPMRSLNCVLFYLSWYCEKSGTVNTELEMLKLVSLYFESVLEDLKGQVKSLEYTNFFTDVKYKLEDSDFTVDGFESTQSVVSVSGRFNRFEFGDMVGNKEVKVWGRRTAMRVCLYDPELQKNPIEEINGLARFRMGFGVPGTGKTLSARCIATIISDYAEMRGIPFVFHPLPDDLISQYQGGSAERMKNWMKALYDPTSIIYAVADDAENMFRDRTHPGASEGSNQVISVFLRGSEGAEAIFHGNVVFDFLTNIPEIMDSAVTSRIQARFPINGAQTVHDWVDQHQLWFSKLAKFNPDFIQVNPLDGYEYGYDQRNFASMAQIESGIYQPKNRDVKEIFERIQMDWGFDDVGFVGHLLESTQDRFPSFSSRDLRNVHTGIDDRLNDYDIPETWFEHPAQFFEKPYEERVEMLRELQSSSFGKLSFGEVCVSEALRYIDTYASMADRDFDRRVNEIVKQAQIREAAEAQLRQSCN